MFSAAKMEGRERRERERENVSKRYMGLEIKERTEKAEGKKKAKEGLQ